MMDYSVRDPRPGQIALLRAALARGPVVLLAGPRQCGKTTLARMLVPEDSPNYFDLEDPVSFDLFDQPMTALEPLRGLVVIDEVQRRPELFPILRVLADRRDAPARFLRVGDGWYGVECKRADAPRMTRSIHTALDDLRLARVAVVYPGSKRYAVAPAVDAVPLRTLRSIGTAEELRAHLWAT